MSEGMAQRGEQQEADHCCGDGHEEAAQQCEGMTTAG